MADQRITDLLPAPVEPSTGNRTTNGNLEIGRALFVGDTLNLFNAQAFGSSNYFNSFYKVTGGFNFELRRPGAAPAFGGGAFLTNNYSDNTSSLKGAWFLEEDPTVYQGFADDNDDAIIRKDYLVSYVAAAAGAVPTVTDDLLNNLYGAGDPEIPTARATQEYVNYNVVKSGVFDANGYLRLTIGPPAQRLEVVVDFTDLAYLRGQNNINQKVNAGTCVGGAYNKVSTTTARFASIVGGNQNTLSGATENSTIVGGSNNTLLANAGNSAIVGGSNNTLSGSYGGFIAASQNVTSNNQYTAVLGVNLGAITIPTTAAGSIVGRALTLISSPFTASGTSAGFNFGTITQSPYGGGLLANGAHLAVRFRGTYVAGAWGLGDMFTFNGGLYTVTANYTSTGSTPTAASVQKLTELFTPVPSNVKFGVMNTANTWVNGELQNFYLGSVPGMKFCDANYLYHYTNGMNDTDGTAFVWVRLLKSI